MGKKPRLPQAKVVGQRRDDFLPRENLRDGTRLSWYADASMVIHVRQAVPDDVPTLQDLIRASVRGLQANDYTPEQRERALETVFGVDTQLIADGTYLVAETLVGKSRIIVGCGGWSQRKTLFGNDHCAGREDTLLDPAHDSARIRAFFVHSDWARRGVGSRILEACEDAATKAGYRALEMAATLTGAPLYRARGYVEGQRREVPLGSGLSLTVVHMVKQLSLEDPRDPLA